MKNLLNSILYRPQIETLLCNRDIDKRKLYLNQIWSLLYQDANFRNSFNHPRELRTPASILQLIPAWKIYRIGSDVKAVVFYSDQYCKKIITSVTDR